MRALLFAALWVWMAVGACAQTQSIYEEWERVATRAEEAVANARASDGAFEELRAEIDAFRADFADAQGTNASRLATLREQLSALGPAPAEEGVEAAGIAERRAELSRIISNVAAPGVAAGEAFERADGIIGEIDSILRERRAEALMARGPTPLDPAIYPTALRELNESLFALVDGIERSWTDGSAKAATRSNLPLIVLLLFVGVVFVARARRWLQQLVESIEGEDGHAAQRVSGFVVSLGQIVVPFIGLLALSRALLLTGFFQFYGQALIAFIPAFGLTIFTARWLGGRLFPSAEVALSPLSLPWRSYRSRRFTLLLAGLVLALLGLARLLGSVDGYGEGTRVAIQFPLIAILGLLLFRIGQILRGHQVAVDAEGEPAPNVLDRVISILSQLARVAGIAGPLLALVGYLNASEALVIPSLQTLGVIAALALLIYLGRDLFVLVTRQHAADESLIPVLVAIALSVLALPLLALVWGATATDLREVWVRVQEGISIGETTISPGSFVILVVVFVLGYMITRFIQSALRGSVLPRTRLDIGGQTAVVSGVGYIGIFLAALVAISSAGLNLSSLAIVAGALSVGIGFGLQTITSNFVSGIILLIERPISEGDWIEVNGNMGYVRDISVRSTRIETFDRTDVIVPNADFISGTVTNYTRGNTVGRVIVPVGVAYGTDTRRVESILREVAQAHPMVALNPEPNVLFMGFGADSLDFEIRAILRDVNWVMSVKSDMNHAIAERFEHEGIEIPFAQRDVWLRNPEVLGSQKDKDLSEED